MEPDGSSAVKPGNRYTLEEWRQWPEDERWELIRGFAWAMSPAPRLNHQRLLLHLSTQLATQLHGTPCEPFIAPVDLFLEDDTVVQPDLMIVCDTSKCRDEGIVGAPEWVLEILSSGTAWKDQTEKKLLYQNCGVREYWILNPDTLDLIIYRLAGERFGTPVGARLEKPIAIDILPEITLTAVMGR